MTMSKIMKFSMIGIKVHLQKYSEVHNIKINRFYQIIIVL